ncbi:hypothetical protein J2Z60_000141 [Lactobacillus colini]|uniref:Uncharacterized protein n=1 Tax=Lactobacillus colini TaxID=1819254 RepID=A0ABS4MBC7_9LACO|nr:hypothetical protein [Lactobacillus colini]MBP2056979.1 hypothetical protein [Lactobacillus colini]
MLSKNQTTQVGVDVNGAFTRNASERLKESQRRQEILDEKEHRLAVGFMGWAIVAVFIALLVGLAI